MQLLPVAVMQVDSPELGDSCNGWQKGSSSHIFVWSLLMSVAQPGSGPTGPDISVCLHSCGCAALHNAEPDC